MPNNTFKHKWDFYIVVLLIFVAIVLPYQVAFFEKTGKTWKFINYFVDFSFLIDIVLTFFSAQVDIVNQEIITDKNRIAKKYLTSWFIVDVLSITPFDLIFTSN